ncbi:hypothetical protein Dimus_025654 [Dionaea muscipula]
MKGFISRKGFPPQAEEGKCTPSGCSSTNANFLSDLLFLDSRRRSMSVACLLLILFCLGSPNRAGLGHLLDSFGATEHYIANYNPLSPGVSQGFVLASTVCDKQDYRTSMDHKCECVIV